MNSATLLQGRSRGEQGRPSGCARAGRVRASKRTAGRLPKHAHFRLGAWAAAKQVHCTVVPAPMRLPAHLTPPRPRSHCRGPPARGKTRAGPAKWSGGNVHEGVAPHGHCRPPLWQPHPQCLHPEPKKNQYAAAKAAQCPQFTLPTRSGAGTMSFCGCAAACRTSELNASAVSKVAERRVPYCTCLLQAAPAGPAGRHTTLRKRPHLAGGLLPPPSCGCQTAQSSRVQTATPCPTAAPPCLVGLRQVQGRWAGWSRAGP